MLILPATATLVPAGQSFACTPIAVYDGDGPIWCAEGPRTMIKEDEVALELRHQVWLSSAH
jgi:hypothetical protein